MIRNIGLSTFVNIYRALLQLALNVVLARFLSPGDFGLIALILPITLFVLLVGDFGLSAAIIRSPLVSALDAGAAAVICIAFGAALLLIAALLLGTGLLHFSAPQLGPVLLAFALVLALALAAVAPRAILERRLAYGRIAAIETVGSTIGFVAAVATAAGGGGLWAFPAYHLLLQAIRAGAFHVCARDGLRLTRQIGLAKGLMQFGGWVVGFNLVNYLARNVDNYIVAGFLGAGALGIYAFAYQIMMLPLMALTWPASAVLLATLARVRDDPAAVRRTVTAVLALTATLTFPAMSFVALRGDLMFSLLLPPRWHGLGAVAGVLAFVGATQSVTSYSGAVMILHGRARLQFWIGAALTTLVLAMFMIAAALAHDLMPVVLTYAGFAVIQTLVQFGVMARLLEMRLRDILLSLLPGALASALASLAAIAAGLLVPLGAPLPLRAIIAIGAFAFAWAAIVLAQRRRMLELVSLLRGAGTSARPIDVAAATTSAVSPAAVAAGA